MKYFTQLTLFAKAMNISIFFLYLLSISKSFACEVSAPERLILTSKVSPHDFSKVLTYKSCETDIQIQLNKLLTDFRGMVNTKVVQTETGIKNIKLKNQFFIQSLIEYINRRHPLQENWRFIEANFVALKNHILPLKKGQSLSFSCQTCNTPGIHNSYIVLENPLKATGLREWLQVKIGIKVKALVSNHTISVDNKPLRENQFSNKEVYSFEPDQLFTNTVNLPYYKLNKALPQGSLVKFSDLSPINLVKLGMPVQIIFKQGNLSLHSTAKASQAGRLGDLIQLRNIKNNKTIIGKVINFNTVEIEL